MIYFFLNLSLTSIDKNIFFLIILRAYISPLYPKISLKETYSYGNYEKIFPYDTEKFIHLLILSIYIIFPWLLISLVKVPFGDKVIIKSLVFIAIYLLASIPCFIKIKNKVNYDVQFANAFIVIAVLGMFPIVSVIVAANSISETMISQFSSDRNTSLIIAGLLFMLSAYGLTIEYKNISELFNEVFEELFSLLRDFINHGIISIILVVVSMIGIRIAEINPILGAILFILGIGVSIITLGISFFAISQFLKLIVCSIFLVITFIPGLIASLIFVGASHTIGNLQRISSIFFPNEKNWKPFISIDDALKNNSIPLLSCCAFKL
ncbi:MULTISPECIES: hypothetical protein [Moorena]|uniref:Uncharacterized protein n=2 Tax=Coleofasciculaceae TaxID=1892251 RepID=F4XWX0_9CYAN|nr:MULTISPECIES: hypothetical protein [Moorena]EGJ30855.1 hypothetical protein LYNGBM3L_46210 [Moorena producens 3L]NEP70147.1 hypothetical protein [Moorena sp. SIO3A5]